jgi:membrane-anchored protein YejM (alkaline phosphatase superfamily)
MHTSNNVVMDMYIMLEYPSVFEVSHVCGMMYIYVVFLGCRLHKVFKTICLVCGRIIHDINLL